MTIDTTEDLVTALSRLSGVLAVACNSAFAHKGSLEGGLVLASELGVDHPLKVSVQRSRLADDGLLRCTIAMVM